MDMETNIVSTLGKLKIIRAKDSEFFKDRNVGFVARTELGSEYYGATQRQATSLAIKMRGADIV
jgi:hypothetical protein